MDAMAEPRLTLKLISLTFLKFTMLLFTSQAHDHWPNCTVRTDLIYAQMTSSLVLYRIVTRLVTLVINEYQPEA